MTVNKEKTTDKLVKILNYKLELEDQKKEMNRGFSENIKAAKRKINCLTRAIDKNDFTILVDCGEFDQFELKELE